MSWLDETIAQSLVNMQQQQMYSANAVGLRPGDAYARFNPAWETGTPKYLDGAGAYNLAVMGYNTNTLAYACISLWGATIAESPMAVYKIADDEPELQNKHPLTEFLSKTNPRATGITEQDFWTATEIYRKVAGFAAWNIERNNNGKPIALWPMRPDFCSFLAGPDTPLRAIRYMPYGLPFVDIDMSDIVYFADFNPLFPFKKPLGPTQILAPILGLDNSITALVNNFVVNGAFLGGVLTTVSQTLSDAEADRIKRRWKDLHGGPDHAGDIAVFGQGVEFKPTSQTFREMVFPELDARSEARICMGYGVKPILISAKIGMDRSTMNNYKEGKASWYEENVTNEWRFLSARMTNQLLPQFDNDPDMACEFDTRKIMAMQEDRTQRWTRADSGYKSETITLNEARREKGLDPVDGGDNVFYAARREAIPAPAEPKADTAPAQPEQTAMAPDTTDEMDDEIKQFRVFAKRRLKEGKGALLAAFEFKYVPLDDQLKLLAEFGVKTHEPGPVDIALYGELKRAVMQVKSMLDPQPIQPQPINITAHIQPGQAPTVHVAAPNVTVKGAEAQTIPAPVVNVTVNPTPVTIENTVNVPKAEPRNARIITDADGKPTGIQTV